MGKSLSDTSGFVGFCILESDESSGTSGFTGSLESSLSLVSVSGFVVPPITEPVTFPEAFGLLGIVVVFPLLSGCCGLFGVVGTCCCSSIMCRIIEESLRKRSFLPSEVVMSFTLTSVLVAFTPFFTFNVILTTSPSLLLLAFRIATNCPFAGLYLSDSQLFWQEKLLSTTSSKICLSYSKVALYALTPF